MQLNEMSYEGPRPGPPQAPPARLLLLIMPPKAEQCLTTT